MADETTAVPTAGRPQMPDGYGIPENNDGLLSWRYVDERMAQSRNYWLCSVRPDGRPHSVPLWAAWVDGAPDTIHNRNVAANPTVSVHLEDGTAAVILEGFVRPVAKPDGALAERIAADYRAKYASHGYAPSPDQWDEGGLPVVMGRHSV
jgi:hypothetical protein